MSDPGSSADRSSNASRLRVATLNLQGQDGAWSDRRSVLIDGLRELRTDVVAFQDAIRTDDYDQAADLLGPGYHIAHQTTGREANGSGVEIASRWPVGDVQEVGRQVTPRTVDFPAMVLVAEVLVPGPIGPLLVVNQRTAFQVGQEHERELQAVNTARLVEKLVGDRRLHVVLASDPTPLLMRPACASGRAANHWAPQVSATGMRGNTSTEPVNASETPSRVVY
jgi:endonuclease/exonuclease/phosphatase family protein